MEIGLSSPPRAGVFIIRVDGRDYERRNFTWYDAKSHIGIPVIAGQRLEAMVRSSPELRERFEEHERRVRMERHRERLESLGLPYKGAGPSHAWAHRVTHCWACKHPLDSEVDLQCHACWWILCRCGGCGCGFYGWGYRAH